MNDIYSTKESLGFYFNPKAYTDMLVAHATKGNISAVYSLLKEFQSKYVIIIEPLFSVYSSLVQNGFKDDAAKVCVKKIIILYC